MIPKFRAWDKNTEDMVDVKTIDLEKDGSIGCILDYNGINLDVSECILMQSTGLKDKNGVEIFEGDICIQRGEEPYSDENMTLDDDWEYTGIIKFQDFAYWIQDNEGFSKWLGTDCDEIEVIGNIYENPELLEVAE
ncbi:YopX family protein [Enterococcus faecalis]